MKTTRSTIDEQAVDEGELSVLELRQMASRQQQQIDHHQQQLVAKEQRLRYLKQQENRHQALTSEAERLRRLREKVESQELKLRKLRALRGQSDQQRANNASLIMDLEHIRAVFNEKEKELSVAVARVDEMSRQLEEVRRDRQSQRRGGGTTGGHTALELDKLRRELMYHNQLNEQQQSQLAGQRQLIEQKREQMAAVDRRVAELQQRLHRKRAHNQQLAQQINATVSSKKPAALHPSLIVNGANRSAVGTDKSGNGLHANGLLITNGNMTVGRTGVQRPPPPAQFLPTKTDPKYQTLPHSTKFSGQASQMPHDSNAAVSTSSESAAPAERVNAATVISRLNEAAAVAPSGGLSAITRLRSQPQGAATNAQQKGPGANAAGSDSSGQLSDDVTKSSANHRSFATNGQSATAVTPQLPPKPSSAQTTAPSQQQQQKQPQQQQQQQQQDQEAKLGTNICSTDGVSGELTRDEPDRMAVTTAAKQQQQQQLFGSWPAGKSAEQLQLPASASSDAKAAHHHLTNNNNNNSSQEVQLRQSNLSTGSGGGGGGGGGGGQCVGGRRGRRVSFDPLALLLDASLEGELELVKKTAVEVDDPSASNDEGITALHNSICAGHLDIVRFLVEFGCDVNAQDSDGWTPLHCAASCNNLSMVRFLVERGACIFAATLSDQETAAEKCEEDEEGYHGCSQYLYSVQEKLGILNGGRVYSLYSYTAQNSDELSITENQPLTIVRKGDDQERDWWWARTLPASPATATDADGVSNSDSDSVGKHSSQEGYVPRNLLGLYPRVVRTKRAGPTEQTNTTTTAD